MARECWAKSLGDCDGDLSREHPVSKCVFPDRVVTVSGFDFCKNNPKQLHINSLTAKVLCEGHNQRLGKEVDHAGGQLFESLRRFTTRRNQQSDLPHMDWLPVQHTVDSRRLERWFLKTMLGISFRRDFIVGSAGSEPGVIPPELVRIAFGLDEFDGGRGLYIAFNMNETFLLEDRFHYTGKMIGNNLVMGYFTIHGLRFYLNLEVIANSMPFDRIESSQVLYRKAHFIEASPVRTPKSQLDPISSLIRERGSFTQKLSIT